MDEKTLATVIEFLQDAADGMGAHTKECPFPDKDCDCFVYEWEFRCQKLVDKLKKGAEAPDKISDRKL